MVDLSEIKSSAKNGRRSKADVARLTEAALGISRVGGGLRDALEGAGISKTAHEFAKIDKAMKQMLGGMGMEKAGRQFAAFDKAMKKSLGHSGLGEIANRTSLSGKALMGVQALSERYNSIVSPVMGGSTARLADLDSTTKALREATLRSGIDQIMLNMGPQPELPEPYFPDFIEPLPNPAFQTNALLEKLGSDVEEMNFGTAAIARVQERQATLVSELLAAIVEGAKAQEAAASETLRVAKVGIRYAKIGIWISLGAALLGSAAWLV